MPTAKKLYTFNETINKTGLAPITSEEELAAYMEDAGNYIYLGESAYLCPLHLLASEENTTTENIIVCTCTSIGEISNIYYYEEDGVVDFNLLPSLGAFEISDQGNLKEWIAANATAHVTIDVESENGVKLLVGGKLCEGDITVVPKLTEKSVTPMAAAQSYTVPEGFAGFRSFTVSAIPSDYVPDGYVPEGTVPDGYVPEGTVPEGYIKPDGAITVTENVTDMDITDKKTLTVAVEGGSKLNVAYGYSAPEDTSKLWVKTDEPTSLAVRLNADVTGNEGLLSGIAALPKKAAYIGTASVGTKVYLFGGYNGSYLSTINVFDTETGTIEELSATLPSAAYSIGTAAVGTKIYLFGGNGSDYLSTINVFDTETGTIEKLSATLPKKAANIGTAAIGTKIYLFGGYGGSYISTINVFNTETGTIEKLSATLPSAAYGIGTAAVGTKIYLFGGNGSDYLSTINVFDTETGTIEELSATLPSAAYSIGTAAVGTKIYLFGGNGSGYYSSIHQFTALIDLPENNMLIEASAFENRFNLLPNLEMGVKNVYLGGADGKGERVAAALYKDGAWVDINSGVATITFTINDVTYYAERGMTFGDWMLSAYNTDSRFTNLSGDVWDTQESKYVCMSDGSHVASAAEIEDGDAYTLGS